MGGAALVLGAMVLAAYAYSNHLDAILEAAKQAGMQLDPRSKTAKARPAVRKAAPSIVLGVFSGLILGFYRPLLTLGSEGDNGLAPYGLALLFVAGAVISTFVLTPFFLNFPVSGAPARFGDYFKGTFREHVLGIFGGMIWATGLVSGLVAASTPVLQRPSPAVRYALEHGAILVAVLCGLVLWGEYKKAEDRTRTFFGGTVLLLAVGVGMISLGAA